MVSRRVVLSSRGKIEVWGIAGDNMNIQSGEPLYGQRPCQDQVEVKVDGREEVVPLMHGRPHPPYT